MPASPLKLTRPSASGRRARDVRPGLCVLLVASDGYHTRGLRADLARRRGIGAVHHAAGGEDAVAMAALFRPGIILVSLEPEIAADALFIARLRAASREGRIVLIGEDGDGGAELALAPGVRGYLRRDTLDPEKLAGHLERVAHEDLWVGDVAVLERAMPRCREGTGGQARTVELAAGQHQVYLMLEANIHGKQAHKITAMSRGTYDRTLSRLVEQMGAQSQGAVSPSRHVVSGVSTTSDCHLAPESRPVSHCVFGA